MRSAWAAGASVRVRAPMELSIMSRAEISKLIERMAVTFPFALRI